MNQKESKKQEDRQEKNVKNDETFFSKDEDTNRLLNNILKILGQLKIEEGVVKNSEKIETNKEITDLGENESDPEENDQNQEKLKKSQ